jgi:hypothetical protein
MCDFQLMLMDNVLVSYLECLKFIMCDICKMFLVIPHHLMYTRLLHGSETVCRHQKWFFTIFEQTEAGNVIKPLIRIIEEKNNLYIYVFARAVITFILCFIAANIAIFLS